MIDFINTNTGIVLKYVPETAGTSWVWNELKTHSTVTISKVFILILAICSILRHQIKILIVIFMSFSLELLVVIILLYQVIF